MSKVFLVAKREFVQRVRTRGFILSAILVPLILLVSMLAGGFSGELTVVEEREALERESTTDEPAVSEPAPEAPSEIVAYVDEAGLIERTPSGGLEAYLAFADLGAADAALAAGDIDAYYVIAPDYRQTGNVRRVSAEFPAGPPETTAFDWLLRFNLLPAAEMREVARVQNPFQSFQLPVRGVRGEAETATGDGLNMMPFLVAMLVMVPLFTSGSYLLYSLTEEKSSRVMEILLVSLRPPALLAGKLLGLGALTLVQYAIWITLGAGVLLVVGQDVSGLLGAINLTPQELVLVLLFALGGYGLYATLMAGLGALSPNLEATRSWVFVITLPMLIPIYLWVVISGTPHGALAVGMSLFPFSAPIAMLMRLASTTVPMWQVVVSLLLLVATAVFMVWLMSRLFRVQTLLSGEAFSVRRFWNAVREG